MIFKESPLKSCNHFFLRHCFFLERGEGWAPAVLNTQREADFIGQTARIQIGAQTGGPYIFLLGGSSTVISSGFETIDLIHYRTGNTGNFIATRDLPIHLE